jgi:hypothetical protein
MPALFGEIVVDIGYVTHEQLQEAVEFQKKGRARLGQVMVHLRILSQEQVEKALAHQKSEHGAGKVFGNCALELGLISAGDLSEAVRYQTTSKGVLGDILIHLGYLTREQRDEVIKEQLRS